MAKGKPIQIKAGARFGRLIFLRETEPRKRLAQKRGRTCAISVRRCEVHCDCGKSAEIDLQPMCVGKVSSCGCLRKEQSTARLKSFRSAGGNSRFKHGHSRVGKQTPEYRSWRAAQARCLDPNNEGYSRYGGNGITFCDRWQGEHGFENFLADMGPRFKGRTLGRFGDIGNYEPGNVAWQTRQEQQAEQKVKRELKFLARVDA